MIKFLDNVWYQDNVYSPENLYKIGQELFDGFWQYKGDSGNQNDGSKFWYQALNQEQTNFFGTITDNKIIRAYVNGQTMTQHSAFHADDGDWTYLIYLDPEWELKDGGGTEFLLENNTTACVYPKFNRVVKFKSGISHRALPNIKQYSFRMTVALKTNES